MFNFPDRLWMTVIGQIGHGIIDPFVLVPSLSEMVDVGIQIYPNMDEKVNDISAGIFNMFLGFGQILGALYGT